MSGYAELAGYPPSPQEDGSPQPPPAEPAPPPRGKNPVCACSPAQRARTAGSIHEKGCPVLEQQVATIRERDAREAAKKKRQDTVAAKRAAAAAAKPKSGHRGRITDAESSRREAEQMGKTALNDPRLTSCMRFCYLEMAARWYDSGSVFVVGSSYWLADRSDGRYSVDQCKRALVHLKTLGYIEPKSWDWVKKKDRGLYAYVKGTRIGKRGLWPTVYHMRQDLPERGTIPDEENPLLQMAAAAV